MPLQVEYFASAAAIILEMQLLQLKPVLLRIIAQIIAEDRTGKQWEIINSIATGEELRHNWFKAEVSCTPSSTIYNAKRQSLLLPSLSAFCRPYPDLAHVDKKEEG